MSVDPGYGERLAHKVSDLYAAAQISLLRRIAQALVRGDDGPDWATRKMLELDMVRRRIARELGDLEASVATAVPDVLREAYLRGQALAILDVDVVTGRPASPPSSRGVDVIASELLGRLRPVTTAALRSSTDLYQRVVAEAAATVLTGAATRLDATQTAVTRLSESGLTGFRDSAGRNWNLETYSEMATRSAAGRAAVDGHVDQLQLSGLDLVVVSDAPRECPLCAPWEGKVLSLGGTVGSVVERPSVVGGAPVRVSVAGTLAEARSAGLMHPNCRHSVSAYLPGATKPKPHKSEPEGYEAQQQQRALERRIRAAKVREATAVTPAAEADAKARVRAAQAALRDHLSANPALKRQPARERAR